MRSKFLVASFAGVALATVLHAQEPVFGPEFQVNTYTTGLQYGSNVANIGANGNFLVTWASAGQDGSSLGVFGRLFDVTGTPISAEIPINVVTTGDQGLVRVQSNAAGSFVVTWTGATSPTDYEIIARRFDATGAPQGGEILVNTFTTGIQSLSSVALSSSGSFVVVWHSNLQDGSDFGVFGQRFNNAGAPVGGEFMVNEYTTSYQARPRIAMNPGGDFIVVWNSEQDAQAGAIMARRFDANAVPLGSEFQVNTTVQGAQYQPDVSLDPAGKANVVWLSYAQDGSDAGIFGQRLDASGAKLGPEFNVNTFTTGVQRRQRVAAGPEGDFTVIWHSDLQDGSGFGVFAQHYDPTGKREFLELPVNTYTTGNQAFPAIAAQPNGQFVAVWESFGQDGSDSGIQARVAGFPDVEEMLVDELHSNAPAGPPGASNLNGVFESGESVSVEPAFRNPSSSALALTGTASNIRGLPGPTYTLDDTTADYGLIAAGATNNCFFTTANCYRATVTGARPAQHWDAAFDETLSYNAFTRVAALHMGGSFPDVPQDGFYRFIENLFHNGVTAGCAGGGYCPDASVTRAQMAVFLLKARHGIGFLPAPETGLVFPDVLVGNPFSPWIEELFREGITSGCGGGLYCPGNPVTREQMAVFLLKTREGANYAPPPGTGVFADVSPCPAPLCNFIEDMYNQQITAGCQIVPDLRYCPLNPVLRKQMAVFLVTTFGLQLYGN